MSNGIEKEVLICDCFSTEHQFVFTYCKGEYENEFDDLSIEIRLVHRFGFWKRIVVGIKYIFGYRSRFGDWDCFDFDHENCDKLINALQNLKKNRQEIIERHERNKNGNTKI